MEQQRSFRHIRTLRQFLERYQRHLSSFALALGFTVDLLTLVDVDFFWTKLLLTVYLVGAAVGVLLINLYEAGKRRWISEETYLWLLIFVQFCYGGLFGRFLIYFSRSASLFASWPFLLILGVLLIGNEFARKYYARLTLHVSFLFIAAYAYFILFVPLLTRKVGDSMFLFAGVCSLLFVGSFLFVLDRLIPARVRQYRFGISARIVIVFFVINTLYFTNIIPPIPLSLQDAGVYHSIVKANGTYRVTAEDRSTIGFLDQLISMLPMQYPVLHLPRGASAYVYSSVFAPVDFGTDVVHEWQYYDEAISKWVTADTVKFPILGGQDRGYRGYSIKTNITPGYWRVYVETVNGQVIGALQFKIERVTTIPTLVTKVK